MRNVGGWQRRDDGTYVLMEKRFTFMYFVLVVLFGGVTGAVAWVGYQFNHQEERLTDVMKGVEHINTLLASGVRVNGDGAATQTRSTAGRIRRKNPDGSVYVYYPDPPKAARDPTTQPDYATGDWLVQNLDSEPAVIAPYIEKDYVGQQVQMPVQESMLGQNAETYELEPVLAESYWMSADGMTMRFKLRSNICFSDGSPVTPEDVIFSYETIMNPGVDKARD